MDRDSISNNFNDFESGRCNVLLITGYAGSGKSSMGMTLAKNYNCEYLELDRIEPILMKKYGKEYISKLNEKEFSNLILRYIKTLKKRTVVEGVQLLMCDMDELMKFPLILRTTNLVKSSVRAMDREIAYNKDFKIDYLSYPLFNIDINLRVKQLYLIMERKYLKSKVNNFLSKI